MYTAASTTLPGRVSISAAIMFFESFLANNAPFGSLDEIVTFIYNVIEEDRYYNDLSLLDKSISLEETWYKLMSNCGFDYMPTEEDCYIIWDILESVTQEDLNRLFYKNNLYCFMDNSSMQKAIVLLLQKLDKPFMDPNKPPREIEAELDEFLDILTEYVFYDHQIIDRLDKINLLPRKVSIIIDTDSTIASLDAWYRYVLDRTYDIPMKIKTMELDMDSLFYEEGEELEYNEIEPEYDYDFYTDELIEREKVIIPGRFIMQDGLRYSIINIMAYCVGKLVNKHMISLTKSCNSWAEDKPCYLFMKNEFLFARALVLPVKKNYATIVNVQEGHTIPEDKELKITGIDCLIKSTYNESTRKNLQKIVYEDILKSREVNQIQVLKDLAKTEKKILNTIRSGSKDYYKPLKIKSINAYDDPMRMQGIKSSIVYNACRDHDVEAIDLEKRNSIDIIKVDISLKNVDRIKDSYPEVYERLLGLLNKKEFKGQITSIALPLNVDVPKWVLEFVDYATILNDNLSGFPLESIGLYTCSKSNNMTNIIRL